MSNLNGERQAVDVFEVGGVEFYNEKEAIAYKEIMQKLLSYQYYVIETKLEGTYEGFLYSELLILAKVPETPISFIYNYLFQEYGNPVVEVGRDKLESNYKIYEQVSFKKVKDLQEFYQEQKVYAQDNLMKMKFIKVDNKGKSSRFILDKERIINRIINSTEIL